MFVCACVCACVLKHLSMIFLQGWNIVGFLFLRLSEGATLTNRKWRDAQLRACSNKDPLLINAGRSVVNILIFIIIQ